MKKEDNFRKHFYPDFQFINPITLQISNGSTMAISNFDILNPKYLSDGFRGGFWCENGNLIVNSITIKSLSETTSFQEILRYFQNYPFTVGALHFESIEGPIDQVEKVFIITSLSQDGKLNATKILPFKDIFQVKNRITFNTKNFNIGPKTKLTCEYIYPMTIFQVTIFPKHVIDLSAALHGLEAQKQFNRPNVIYNLHS